MNLERMPVVGGNKSNEKSKAEILALRGKASFAIERDIDKQLKAHEKALQSGRHDDRYWSKMHEYSSDTMTLVAAAWNYYDDEIQDLLYFQMGAKGLEDELKNSGIIYTRAGYGVADFREGRLRLLAKLKSL